MLLQPFAADCLKTESSGRLKLIRQCHDLSIYKCILRTLYDFIMCCSKTSLIYIFLEKTFKYMIFMHYTPIYFLKYSTFHSDKSPPTESNPNPEHLQYCQNIHYSCSHILLFAKRALFVIDSDVCVTRTAFSLLFKDAHETQPHTPDFGTCDYRFSRRMHSRCR